MSINVFHLVAADCYHLLLKSLSNLCLNSLQHILSSSPQPLPCIHWVQKNLSDISHLLEVLIGRDKIAFVGT